MPTGRIQLWKVRTGIANGWGRFNPALTVTNPRNRGGVPSRNSPTTKRSSKLDAALLWHLDRLVELSPANRSLYLERGCFAYSVNRRDEALKNFLEAMAIRPEGLSEKGNAVLHLEAQRLAFAGYWLNSSNKLQEAEAAIREAITLMEVVVAEPRHCLPAIWRFTCENWGPF